MKFKRSSKTNWNGLLSGSLLLLFITLINPKVTAQNVAINTDGSKADVNAIVDIKSTTKGLLIPRMTTAQRLRVPHTNGLMGYDVTTKSLWYSNVESWQIMALTAASTDAWLLGGNAGTVDGPHFLGTT